MSKKNNMLVALAAGLMVALGVILVAGGSIPGTGGGSNPTYTIKGNTQVEVSSLVGFNPAAGFTWQQTWYASSESSIFDPLKQIKLMFFGDTANIVAYASIDGGSEQTIYTKAVVNTILGTFSERTSDFMFYGLNAGDHTLKLRITWDTNQHERIETYKVVADNSNVVKTAERLSSEITR